MIGQKPLPPLVSARVEVLRADTSDGLAMSFAALTARTMVLVSITGDNGVTGVGESWVNFPSWAPAERLATLADGVLPLLRGGQSRTPSEWHSLLDEALHPIGRQWGAPGPIAQAISAVDVALWDLQARTNGTSIAGLWGDRRGAVPAYASSLGPTGYAEQAQGMVDAGHHSVKVKVGFGRDRDAAALARIRAIVGDDVAIFADANQGWTVDEAVAMVPVLRDAGVDWIEEPIRGDRLEDLEEFHRRTAFPIATGENLYGVETFARYCQSPAIAHIQPDVSKAGGLTPLADIAVEAARHDTVVLPHLYNGAIAYAATLQLAAAFPQVGMVEFDVRQNPLRDPLLVDAPVLESGIIPIPDGPGLGVALDPAAVAERLVSGHNFTLA